MDRDVRGAGACLVAGRWHCAFCGGIRTPARLIARMWGTSLRQRLRLMPLYLALVAADCLRTIVPARRTRVLSPFRKGVSIVIPDRDAPELLAIALESVLGAISGLDEPCQIIVVANGARREGYSPVLARYPQVELVHRDAPLGFSAAIALGLREARYDWTYLMNNDV